MAESESLNADLAPRTMRIRRFLDEQKPEELRETTLQAIDHAYKSAAEVAEMRAVYEGALGQIDVLKVENERLRTEVDRLQQHSKLVASTAWRAGSRLKHAISVIVRRFSR